MVKKKIKKKIGIVIPALNEENTIKRTYIGASRFGKVCVVNDDSTDKTKEILKKNKFTHISNTTNLGYEKTVLNGINFFIKKVDYIVTIDADLQFRFSDISKLIKKIEKEKLDILVGSRIKKNRISEIILSKVFYNKFNILDPISGLKVYKTKSFKNLFKKISNKLFLVDAITIGLSKKLRIKNKDVKLFERKGYPRIGSSLKANIKIIKIILYVIFFRL